MTTDKLNLSQFFNVKGQAAKKAAKLVKSKQFQAIKEKIADKAGQVSLPSSFYENIMMLMLEKLDELLDIDIAKDIFGTAWSKHQSLLEYRDSEKYPPEQTFLVSLAEHSMKTEHAPVLEPSISGKSLGKLEFQIEANFNIKGAVLEVQDAKILKIRLAAIEGTGTIAFMGITFFEKETEIKLPGILDLGEGIVIRDPFDFQDKKEAAEKSDVEDRPLAEASE